MTFLVLVQSESDYQNFANKFFALCFSFASEHLGTARQCTSTVWGLTLECKQEGMSFGLLGAVHNLSTMTFAP